MYFIYFLLLAVVLVFGVKFAGVKEFHEDGLTLAYSKPILGIMAILIMFHHISQLQPFMDKNELQYMSDVGILFVATFFFFSGYGLIKSMQNKSGYLDHFLKKRLITVLIPFVVVNIIYIFACMAFQNLPSFKIGSIIKYIIGIDMLNGNAWYIVVITIYYILFYLTFRFLNEKIAFVALFLITVIYIGWALPLSHSDTWFHGEWWYNTCILLLVGMLFARFESKIIPFLKKYYYILLPIALVCFYLCFRRNMYMLEHYSYWCEFNPALSQGDIIRNRAFCLAWQIPSILFFVLSVVLIMLKCKFKNPVLDFIGSISLEIYLVHDLFLQYLRTDKFYIDSNFAFAGACVICAIILAFIVHLLNSWIEGLFLKSKKAKGA